MNNARLIKLLKCLSHGELTRFVDFVSTPYFNKNQKSIRLIKLIASTAPSYKSNKLKKEYLYTALFGKGEEYQDQKIHDQISLLTRLLEKYLGQQQFEKDKVEQNHQLLRALLDRQIDSHFIRVYQRTQLTQEKQDTRDASYFFNQYRLQAMEGIYLERSKTRVINQNFSKPIQNLKTFYLASTLRYICELLNRKGIVQLELNQRIIEETQFLIDNKPEALLNVPAISIYYQIFLSLSDPDREENYFSLVNQLHEYTSCFQPDEAYSMYAYAQNYCIKQINRGNTRFRDELFQLYQQLLSEELLMISGHLRHEHYKNITYLGLLLKKFDWVKDFLERYKGMLHQEIQENAYTYNLATYYYESQQYTEAMKLLQQVSFTDVYYDLSARSILLRIFYDLGDFDSLKYTFPAFLAFLKRNKQISAVHIERHKNLIRYVKKAVRIKQKRERLSTTEYLSHIDALKEEIKETRQVANLNWLKEVLEKLEKEVPFIP